ncbi:hypothetical protein A0O28_0029420 [Trichoderma guizhouense]|uniref:Amidase domain-containing protein n=1 Tax=Trichoderma guizhouense TaxID=1491466 RepID=A0A1T3CU74_9HYPO|nr:hypothetical protein A0O28_0029420 [Trichoderma guizhouense]
MALKPFNLLTSTAHDIQQLFDRSELNAESLVKQVLDQVNKHNREGLHLGALIAVAPRHQLLERAQFLDHERAAGKARSPLHGIPFIVKLLDAGGILIGKASLTEFNNFKGQGLIDGWSPVNGYTRSAYVRGPLKLDEGAMGHSRKEYHSVMKVLSDAGVHVQYPVQLPPGDEIWPRIGDIMSYEFQGALNLYLETLESSQVRNLRELVDWNRQHADIELPQEYPSQSSLESALECNISAAENAETLAFLRKLAGPDGIDQILNLFKLDAIASLSDSPLSSVASAAGELPQVRLCPTKAKPPLRLSHRHNASGYFGPEWPTIRYQYDC